MTHSISAQGHTDEAIAERVQAGETERFGELVERYEAKLRRYIRRFVSDGEDSRDLLQDVFMKAYTNLRGFDTDRRFSPWIYRIAHNEVVNFLKRKRPEPFSLFDMDTLFPHLAAAETAEGPAARTEMRQLIDRSLDQLSVKYREPLILFYFDELDYQAIADVLEIPVATVGVRLRRGRLMLRKFVEPFQ
ncbi:MAG: RNA polymerase sigma factor [bacterium]|nr:RNA polymerase sigma factor [bacterium]